MPSKTSARRPPRRVRWKAVAGCSEAELTKLAGALAAVLSPGDRVLLEGPMGAGKTTFARALIQGLGVLQPPEGSPTFAIAHEYESARAPIVHIDFYRLRSEEEIDDAGIPSFFWERTKAIVITEWLSSWPSFGEKVLVSSRAWHVDLAFAKDERRDVMIDRTERA